MELEYHILACKEAFGEYFSQRAFDTIIEANARQDDTINLLRFDFHFDNNFENTWQYIDKQKKILFNSLTIDKVEDSWIAFGRITHAQQDFYSHSNYVRLWAEKYGNNGKLPPPESIEPMEMELLKHPELITAKIYMPFEMITYWERFRAFARRHLPNDSHANMNLDHPERGELFAYAQAASVKKLRFDYQEITQEITQEEIRIFRNNDI